jgi:hypothetical protein
MMLLAEAAHRVGDVCDEAAFQTTIAIVSVAKSRSFMQCMTLKPCRL